MMGVTTVINCAGVDKEKFIDYTEKNPATYRLQILSVQKRSYL